MRLRLLNINVAFASILTLVSFATAGDWPHWRYDAQRSAAGVEELPAELSLAWTRQYDRRVQVWDDPLNHDMMPYDKVFEPIVVGEHAIMGFNDSDKVVAIDVDSGAEVWRFFCDGPVRLPPTSAEGKVYVTSDDGHLYCLSAESGELHWKFRGAPADQKVLGNQRIVNMWPARGGAIVTDGTVYFSSSIWPFLGTFIYALDAETGKVQWVNDGTGSMYIKQPHSAPSFGGVAPQGAMAISGSALVVPGGRSVPAVFDRTTGQLRYFHLNEGGKGTGGSLVMVNEDSFLVHTRGRQVRVFNLKSGKKTEHRMNEPVLTKDFVYAADKEHIVARDPNDKYKELWRVEADGTGDLILAGNRLYAAGATGISVIELPEPGALLPVDENAKTDEEKDEAEESDEKDSDDTKKDKEKDKDDKKKDDEKDDGPKYVPGTVVNHLPVTGEVLRLVAGADRLFAVTVDGRFMAFANKGAAKRIASKTKRLRSSATVLAQANSIIKQMGTREGYGICYGADDGALLEALVSRSQLHIVVVEKDEEKVARLRQRWDDAGLYGRRLTIHQGDPVSFAAPPYIASLVLVGKDSAIEYTDSKFAAAMYRSVRPYGGVLCFQRSPNLRLASLEKLVDAVPLEKAQLKTTPQNMMLVRAGSLPGSAPWTHLYGDIANSVKSDDSLVKLPLGILWFGGNSNTDVLPRHGHGPCEQVVGGRLFIEGMDRISARDVYTGRVLWKRVFADLGTFDIYYDDTYKDTPLDPAYNQVHLPGANLRGTNYVVTEDSIYLVIGATCFVLDPVNGRTKTKIELPELSTGGTSKAWSYLGVYEDILLAGADFSNFTEEEGVEYKKEKKKGEAWSFDKYGSRGLIALDRHTGKKLWDVKANYSFLHNTVIAGGGRVYLIDKLPHTVESQLERRGLDKPTDYALRVIDAKSGKPVWETNKDVFGTWLGFSEEHGILIQAGSAAPDRAKEEVGKGVIAYNAADGTQRWENTGLKYAGPCILLDDMVITNSSSYNTTSGVYNLLDGEPMLIDNSLTGGQRKWTYKRAYGCNTAVASKNLLTFRSGAAGFYDLNAKSGTGNLGGFRAGCSSNLIVADGVLNAPDYTRTCSCGYQNQTSLALVHMPNVEMWTVDQLNVEVTEAIQHVGLNLGAPGDRRDSSGTMWLDYPVESGEVSIEISHEGDGVEKYRRHTTAVEAADIPWVAASGLRNLSKLKMRLAPPHPPAPGIDPVANHTYELRLHFAEPDDLAGGQRVFNVRVQGKEVLADVDVAKTTGGNLRSLTRRVEGVRVESYLTIEFENTGKSEHGPILSGLELIATPEARVATAQD